MAHDPFETVWSFQTPRYRIECAVADEDSSINAHFDDEQDREFASDGGWHWCQVRVQVVFRDVDNPKKWAAEHAVVLGKDYLGACSYLDFADFRRGGYFRDMVNEAISETRDKLARATCGIRATA